MIWIELFMWQTFLENGSDADAEFQGSETQLPNEYDDSNSQLYVLNSEFAGTPAVNLSERVVSVEEKCDRKLNTEINIIKWLCHY